MAGKHIVISDWRDLDKLPKDVYAKVMAEQDKAFAKQVNSAKKTAAKNAEKPSAKHAKTTKK